MTTLDDLQESFTAYLPDMCEITRKHFRRFDPDKREEMVENTLALAWKFYFVMFQKGRAAEPGIVKSLLWYSVKQSKSGRTPQGGMRTRDAFECRSRGKVKFERLDLDGLVGRTTPVPDAVSFRVDVPAFLDTLTPRQQAMALGLASGMTTGEVAEKHGVSAALVSQFRRRFKMLFDDFFGE